MKKSTYFLTLSILIISIVLGFTSTSIAAETYTLDPDHSAVVFRIKHLGIANVFGRFHHPVGRFTFDPQSPHKSHIQVQVAAKNVDTGVVKRDNHLRSADFFNVEKHPLILFESRSVKAKDQNNFEVIGDITLLGNTRTVTVLVTQTGEGMDPWGKFRRGFETTFSIMRKDFGMDFMSGAVGDKVVLTISVEGVRE